MMHRRARNHTSLCRKKCKLTDLSIDDGDVTCEKCLNILYELNHTNSKTQAICKHVTENIKLIRNKY